MRVGLFGGAFDPPHIGHLICAEYALEELGLDKVLFIPSGDHPFKHTSIVTSDEDRLEMVRRATSRNSQFEVSDIELRRTGLTYTIDTIESLKKDHADWDIYLLIGSDNVRDISKWHRFEDILRSVKVAILERAGRQEGEAYYEKQCIFLDTPLVELSSTEIRQRIREGKGVSYLVTHEVEEYIHLKNLYQVNPK
jgi:nicotinate-nucleotide adenylyltransferase